MRFAGGTVGAAVIQILLVFVFLMLISGSTLIGLFRSCAKPVKQLGQSYTARREQREEEERVRMSQIDIPMEGDAPMPEQPVFSPNQSFDKALENFREDPRELRRRKKEAKKLGVDPETAEEDACKMEHDISDQTFKAICDHAWKRMASADETAET